jgi:hypothetical protein
VTGLGKESKRTTTRERISAFSFQNSCKTLKRVVEKPQKRLFYLEDLIARKPRPKRESCKVLCPSPLYRELTRRSELARMDRAFGEAEVQNLGIRAVQNW